VTTLPSSPQALARSGRAPLLRRLTASVAAAATLAAALTPLPAVAEGIPLIRDTEIENLLKDYARPIFKVAGLGGQNIAMRIVRHDSFNAFVVDGRNVFMNSGALMQAKTPNEVIGVIAHETGHITGGHMAQLRARIARDQTKVLLVSLLGIGLLIGGAASGGDTAREVAGAGQGVMMGGTEMIMRSLLGERRAQEAAADQAGLTFLNQTRQSGQGMLETFEKFAQQEYVSERNQDPFVRSHPVASSRIAQLRDLVAKSPHANTKDPSELQLRHDMMRAKISGYLDRSQTVANRYPASDNSLPARYARTIAKNCSGRCASHLADVDALLREQPNNPYFWELKGNLQFWQGQYKDSATNLRKALQMIGGNEPLIQVHLAQSLLATEEAGVLEEGIALLRRSVVVDGENPTAYTLLAKALYKKEQFPQADLAAAQGHFVSGDVKQAQIFAKRAQAKLQRGTTDWIKSEDIISYKDPNPQ
jgi:predicted Zn-dependent protease